MYMDRRSHSEERTAVRGRPGTRDDGMEDRAAEDRTLDETWRKREAEKRAVN